jgi:hypothetical protein
MSKWEFITLVIEYDKKKKDWAVSYTDDKQVVGLERILNSYGSQGWEIVNLQSENLEAYPGFGKWSAIPTSYRATFKRPIE